VQPKTGPGRARANRCMKNDCGCSEGNKAECELGCSYIIALASTNERYISNVTLRYAMAWKFRDSTYARSRMKDVSVEWKSTERQTLVHQATPTHFPYVPRRRLPAATECHFMTLQSDT